MGITADPECDLDHALFVADHVRQIDPKSSHSIRLQLKGVKETGGVYV